MDGRAQNRYAHLIGLVLQSTVGTACAAHRSCGRLPLRQPEVHWTPACVARLQRCPKQARQALF